MVSEYCSKFSPEHVGNISVSNVIKIFKFNNFPPEVEYSILIKDDLQVEAHRRRMKIATRDLINCFTNTLRRYSQIDKIIHRLQSTPIKIRSELVFLGKKVLELVNEIESEEETELQKCLQISFIGEQLLLFNCHHYSSHDMAEAINLYLRSRNSYRAFRKVLVLRCCNTIRHYFGKNGLAGGAKECERTIKNVFCSLNDGQRDCFISFNEIHIKPGLQYQGKYVLGNAQNTTGPVPAKTILAVMINPSYGAPAFVA